MPNISVILPAARLQEQAQEVVDRLWQNDFVKEVVVASPDFTVRGAKCFRDDRAGSARVLAQAYELTDPAIPNVAWLSDICFPAPYALDRLAELVDGRADPFIAEFRTLPPVTPGHYRVCTITGRQYARWGALSRKTVAQIEGFFDPAYVAHYGDVDLSLRCWRAGGRVATCVDATVELHGHWHVSTAPQSADEALFIQRWRADYPFIRSDNTADWNIDQEIPL